MSSPAWIRKLAWSLLATAALCGLAELLARALTGPDDVPRFGQRVRAWMDTGLDDFNACLESDEALFWRLAPERALPEDRTRPFFGRISNEYGWRHGTPREAALRVLCLGDSCTFGFGAAVEQTWPAVLERRLAAQGRDVEVVNAGVPGYASSQGLVLAERLVPEWRPHVVIVAFGWNDGSRWDGRSDAEHRASWARPVWWASRAARLIARGGAALRRELDADADASRAPRVSPSEFETNLARIVDVVRASGGRTLLLAWPFRAQLADPERARTDYQRLTLAAGTRDGAAALDLLPVFRRELDEADYLDHGHVGPAGYAVVGEAVAAAVLANGW